jgi:hypothetical protein
MRNLLLSSVSFCALAISLTAQTKTPRTADGKPDFSGVWQGGGISLYGEVGGNTRSTAAVAKGAPPTAPAAKPEPLLFKPELEAKVQAGAATAAINDPALKCLLPGVPRIYGMPMPFEIVQTPKELVIIFESFHAWRRIPFGGKHDDPDPSFMGDSIASWDGDTLVVDVAGINGKTWLDGRGHFTTEQTHIVERYKLNGDTISYEATVNDPATMTKPWKQTYTLTRLKEGERPLEYECIENNQDVPHMQSRGPGR